MQTIILFLALYITQLASPANVNTLLQDHSVYVNGEKLSTATILTLESRYGIKMLNGKYYYDKISGFWGLEGGPTLGITIPGLPVGGELQSDAANGNTGVFINGMELHWQDVRNIQLLVGYAYPGRYWMDAYGNVGYEGGPALLNLWQLAGRQQRAASTFYHNSYTGIGGGSDGNTSYVIGKDFSVITDHE